MATPAFPAQGSSDWYAWAQAVHSAASDVNDGRLTDASLKSKLVPKWQPSTAYAAGEPVVNPSGQIVTANSAFTSGATYSAANWTVVPGAPVADATGSAKGVIKLAGDLGGTAAAPMVPGLAGKADLASGIVPDAQLPVRLSTTGLNSAIDARGTANGWGSGGGANPADSGYDIVLLMGQSNMSGRGTPYDAVLDPVHPRVWQYATAGSYTNKISQAVEPLGYGDGPTGIGPGLVFARWYANAAPANRQVLLVPVAVGGTALSTASTSGWRRGIAGNLYAKAITQAQGALAAAGANSRYVAALWLQGESDDGAQSAQYQADLDALITGLRTDLGVANLTFVLGRMLPEYITGIGSRANIDAVHVGTPTRLAYTGTAAALPTGYSLDGTHYNAAGQRLMGRAMWTAHLAALANTSVTPTAPTAMTIAATAGNGQVTIALASGGTGSAVTYALYRGTTATGTPIATAFPFTDTGLTNGTAYSYVAKATNTAGSVTSNVATATPATPADTTAPSTPTGLTATAGNAQVMLSWTASTDNVGVTGYKVYRGGTLVGSPTATTYTDTGLTNGTTYSYTVAATDAAANLSAQTSAATATPTSGVTDPTPALSTLRGTPTYAAGKFGNAMSGGVLATTATISSTVGTVECWAKTSSSVAGAAVGNGAGQWFLGTISQMASFRVPGLAIQSSTTNIVDNVWHHLALTVDGTNAKLWVDGNLVLTAASTTTFALATGGQALGVGGWGSTTGYDWPGQVDEVRVSSVVRYSATFTPPSAAFAVDASTLALYHLES